MTITSLTPLPHATRPGTRRPVTSAALPGTDSTDWVLAAPFRAHARSILLDTGLPWRALALHAGVPPQVLRSLLFGSGRGQRRMRAVDALLLWQVDAAQVRALGTTPVRRDAVQARVRLLRRMVGDDQRVADWLRVPVPQVDELARGRAWCSRLTLLLSATALSALGVDGFWSFQHLEGRGFAAVADGGEDADQLPTTAPEARADDATNDPAGLRHWAA